MTNQADSEFITISTAAVILTATEIQSGTQSGTES